MFDHKWNIFKPIAKRRQNYRNDVQSKIEIFAEQAFRDPSAEIMVGGRDDARDAVGSGGERCVHLGDDLDGDSSHLPDRIGRQNRFSGTPDQR